MSHDPESLISMSRDMDNDKDSQAIIVKKEEISTVYRFKENDESKLFRKFLTN